MVTKPLHSPHVAPFSNEDSEAVSLIITRCLLEVNIKDYGEEHISKMLPVFAANNLSRWFDGAEPYVLRVEGRIVGTGTLRGADIQTVFINPDHHGKGYGKTIMSFLEALAHSRGFTEVTLNSSLTSLKFYEALGYTPFGNSFGSVGGTMVAMKKRL